ADGNIWLLDNLALDLTATGASTAITAANTNASATSLNALFNGVEGGGEDENLAQAAVIDVKPDYMTFSDTDPFIDTMYNGDALSDVTDTSETIGGDWPVGIYYNFCAASAGSYCYDGSGQGDATEDICPAGWRMPSSSEYDTLYGDHFSYEVDQIEIFRTALHLPLSGARHSYSYPNDGLGTKSFVWSSTAYDDWNFEFLHIDDFYDYELSVRIDPRGSGFSVRCIMGD
ncbi:hypothetical protein J5491_03110, partial [Candidatus Saccharibacteria bacterium]|nr:hypothetical protein [Candidatus Saccharibacteria bacterium]